MYVCIYIYVYVYIHSVYIYIYIERERERASLCEPKPEFRPPVNTPTPSTTKQQSNKAMSRPMSVLKVTDARITSLYMCRSLVSEWSGVGAGVFARGLGGMHTATLRPLSPQSMITVTMIS